MPAKANDPNVNPTLEQAIAHCRQRLVAYHSHPTGPIPVYQSNLDVVVAAAALQLPKQPRGHVVGDQNCFEVTTGYELYVVECKGCGFHLGVDVTYLRGNDIAINCPSCKLGLFIEEIE